MGPLLGGKDLKGRKQITKWTPHYKKLEVSSCCGYVRMGTGRNQRVPGLGWRLGAGE